MKSIKLILFSISVFLSFSIYAQVAVNTDGANPDASAMLDVKSTDAGILIPRMTASQMNGISSPANGLLVYVTDDNQFYYYNGTAWIIPGGDSDWTVNGNDMYSEPSGNVGINTTTPNEKLEINGSIRIVDGNEASGKVLISDDNGTGSWQRLSYIPIYDELLPSESYEAHTSINFWTANGLCLISTHDGHTDWRIPTLHEAEYLTNLGRFGSVNAPHWTRSPDGAQNGNNRRYTTFNPSTTVRDNSKITDTEYLRCVR